MRWPTKAHHDTLLLCNVGWRGKMAKSAKLVFIHIPKCAGTAMTKSLRGAIVPQSEYIGISISTFGHFDKFDTCSEDCRATIVSDWSYLPNDTDFIYGHLQYQFTRRKYPGHRFLLLTREPRARLVSHWLYWRSNSDEALAPWGEWGEWVKSARQDFADFLSDPRAYSQTDNVAARLLLQPHPLIIDGHLIEESAFPDLKIALEEALDAMDLVGFTEDPGLIEKVEAFLDSSIKYDRENVTFIRDADKNLNVGEQVARVDPAILNRMTFLDNFVWQYALKRSGLARNFDEFADECFRRSTGKYGTPA